MKIQTYALANDNYDVRGKAGTFSAETEDAVDAAHKASAAAHKAGTKDGHERAARMHRLAAKRHTDAGDTENAEMH
jgi:acyl-CoA reductase-like NAD-dependent aldehyde dehydrogenase